jgi:hypothetical protein
MFETLGLTSGASVVHATGFKQLDELIEQTESKFEPIK